MDDELVWMGCLFSFVLFALLIAAILLAITWDAPVRP